MYTQSQINYMKKRNLAPTTGAKFTWETWKPGCSMQDVFINAMVDCLKFHKGNKARAAKSLGVSLRSLRDWVYRDSRLVEFRVRKELKVSV